MTHGDTLKLPLISSVSPFTVVRCKSDRSVNGPLLSILAVSPKTVKFSRHTLIPHKVKLTASKRIQEIQGGRNYPERNYPERNYPENVGIIRKLFWPLIKTRRKSTVRKKVSSRHQT